MVGVLLSMVIVNYTPKRLGRQESHVPLHNLAGGQDTRA